MAGIYNNTPHTNAQMYCFFGFKCGNTASLFSGLSYDPEAKSLWFRSQLYASQNKISITKINKSLSKENINRIFYKKFHNNTLYIAFSMRAVGTLTEPAAPNKIKMPHRDILILSWLTIVNEFRTTYYNDIMNIATSIKTFLNNQNNLFFTKINPMITHM